MACIYFNLVDLHLVDNAHETSQTYTRLIITFDLCTSHKNSSRFLLVPVLGTNISHIFIQDASTSLDACSDVYLEILPL